MKKEEICFNKIDIRGNIARHEIVRKVVNTFIDFEYDKKQKGIVFKYKVEELPNNQFLYIVRPGHKKNFDFKVEVKEEFNLHDGTHKDIASDLKSKKEENKDKFNIVFDVLTGIYKCEENNVDILLKNLLNNTNFTKGASVEILLKVIKWLFIMEDIVYWDNEGRAFLYNYLKYVIETKSNVDWEINNPDRLKRIMKKNEIQWIPCEE